MSFSNLPYEIRLHILEIARMNAFKQKVRKFEQRFNMSRSQWIHERFIANGIAYGYSCTHIDGKFTFIYWFCKSTNRLFSTSFDYIDAGVYNIEST